MYFLNTTRHLATPASDTTIDRLIERLTGGMTATLGSSGVRSNAWLVSADRSTFQAFTGFDEADQVSGAERSPQHLANSAVINELLGGLSEVQQHNHYRLVLSRKIS
jgi:hypothetical protein